jgi:hypothetical protein
MTQKKNLLIWIFPLIICSAFIICAAVGMMIEPEAFHKFFSPSRLFREIPPIAPHKSYYWDVEAYAEMAVNPKCIAFYPLWPFIIRTLFHPQTIEQAAHYFLMVGTALSFISNFLLFWLLNIILNRLYLAFWLVLAYAINPMAIFRNIGYTESLFTILSISFIYVLLPKFRINQIIKLGLLFIITGLMVLTRPILIQIFFATTASIITIFTWDFLQKTGKLLTNILVTVQKYKFELKATITIWISSLLGYSIYGNFCLQNRGDFFAPFHDQSKWGKVFGLHLELLLFPKSMLIDFFGLYLPLIVLFLSIIFVYVRTIRQEETISTPQYKLWWNILFLYPPLLICVYIFNWICLNKSKIQASFQKLFILNYTQTLNNNYVFWFCIYFTVIHSVIIFFTQDRLYSLGRYIFAIPFFYVAVGYLYRCIPGKPKYQILLWFIGISVITLVQQWISYGQDKWLG